MGTKEKLVERFKRLPKDYTFDEAERLLTSFGYIKSNKGKTSGSRVLFSKSNKLPIFLHRPHPQKTLKEYAIKQILNELIRNGDIEL
ncbi:MAG: type II toxin-antitoxin system HicA family toxin [Bacteroidales bacterium]|nr:type II toxin-antitoxin system HicA family toxin [Bacteroidales bacterium]